ncbi:MAG: hypothetical protein JST86_10995 [Bacteroidetes bacterium]|nr:hypothetical protein [Bacteroidota bacterium]
MKKSFLIFCTLFLYCGVLHSFAGDDNPDTVRTGIYVTSIHDIDFKQKEYAVDCWLWLKYKRKEFDFVQNLEIPQAKSVNKLFSTIDSSGGRIYLLMKLQCVMKDSWKIGNFPFDRQNLRMSIENSQYDNHDLVFAFDTLGKHYDPRFTVNGWSIDSFNISVGTKAYETAFGDDSAPKPHSDYSAFKVKINILRDASGLFWKMFLGMYVAFLIAYVCFYIHADGIDSRFSLSVGSLFAVIGNKYIVDSALPESTSFTLVDTLHGLTLFCIFFIISCTAITLRLVKKEQLVLARRFDLIAAQVVLLLYIILNIYFIHSASSN